AGRPPRAGRTLSVRIAGRARRRVNGAQPISIVLGAAGPCGGVAVFDAALLTSPASMVAFTRIGWIGGIRNGVDRILRLDVPGFVAAALHVDAPHGRRTVTPQARRRDAPTRAARQQPGCRKGPDPHG